MDLTLIKYHVRYSEHYPKGHFPVTGPLFRLSTPDFLLLHSTSLSLLGLVQPELNSSTLDTARVTEAARAQTVSTPPPALATVLLPPQHLPPSACPKKNELRPIRTMF